MDSGEATIFRSYDTPTEPASKATIVQAARATSAAPTFFKEQVIDGVKYIDGGIGNNNPALHALAEVDVLWPGREVDAFISIGTGTARNISAKNLKIASISLTTSSHLPHEKIVEMGIFRPDQYFRFNVPNLGSEIDLSDWEKLDYIGVATRRYLSAPGIRDQVKDCAEALCGKLSESV
jgi:predicted acylesterase/phospholipase RssA